MPGNYEIQFFCLKNGGGGGGGVGVGALPYGYVGCEANFLSVLRDCAGDL